LNIHIYFRDFEVREVVFSIQCIKCPFLFIGLRVDATDYDEKEQTPVSLLMQWYCNFCCQSFWLSL